MIRSFAKKMVGLEAGCNGTPAYYIKCKECAREEIVRAGKPSRSLHVTFIRKKFSNLGWDLGRNAEHDVCPQCVSKHKLSYQKSGETIMSNVTLSNVKAEAPAVMTKEDRRIIFAKIDENYLDEMNGYSGGWTDEKIAKDLNIPRAWVFQIREDNFGPEIGEGVTNDINLVKSEIEAAQRLLGNIDVELAHLRSEYTSSMRNLQSARDSFAENIKGAASRLEKISKQR